MNIKIFLLKAWKLKNSNYIIKNKTNKMRNKDLVLTKLDSLDASIRNLKAEIDVAKTKEGLYFFIEQIRVKFDEVCEFVNLEQQA